MPKQLIQYVTTAELNCLQATKLTILALLYDLMNYDIHCKQHANKQQLLQTKHKKQTTD